MQRASDDFILFSMQSTTSEGIATHDGIPTMAKRAVEEVHQWVDAEVIPALREFARPVDSQSDSQSSDDGHAPNANQIKYRLYLSIIGHSLGGLIARYVARLLLDPTPPLFGPTGSSPLPVQNIQPSNPFYLSDLLKQHPVVESSNPLTFMTICTPHLGSRRSVQPASSIVSNFARIVSQLYLNYIAGATGKELLLADGAGGDGWWELDASESASRRDGPGVSERADSTGDEDLSVPLLYRMSLPSSPYMRALAQFRGVTLLSAVRNDVPVAFCSAAITDKHPHPELFDEKRRDSPGHGHYGPDGEVYGCPESSGGDEKDGKLSWGAARRRHGRSLNSRVGEKAEIRVLSYSGLSPSTATTQSDSAFNDRILAEALFGHPGYLDDASKSWTPFINVERCRQLDIVEDTAQRNFGTSLASPSTNPSPHPATLRSTHKPAHEKSLSSSPCRTSLSQLQSTTFYSTPHDPCLMPAQLLANLLNSPLGSARVRRVNIDVRVPGMVMWATTHSLCVGKYEFGWVAGEEVKALARAMGEWIARGVVAEFCEVVLSEAVLT